MSDAPPPADDEDEALWKIPGMSAAWADAVRRGRKWRAKWERENAAPPDDQETQR